MKIPKFYQNQPDNNHCLQATVMMALNTIDSPITWEEVDQITQYEEGLYSWPASAVVALSNKIPNTRIISDMDYVRFAEEGEEYLKEYFHPDWFNLQKSKASPGFQKEQSAAKKLEKKIVQKNIIHQNTVEELLSENLLIALVDVGELSGKNKPSGHFVVVYGQNGNGFFIHDPGLPPQQGWQVNKEKFMVSTRNTFIVIPWPANKTKIGRNDLCPCNSHKKFKNCCGN